MIWSRKNLPLDYESVRKALDEAEADYKKEEIETILANIQAEIDKEAAEEAERALKRKADSEKLESISNAATTVPAKIAENTLVGEQPAKLMGGQAAETITKEQEKLYLIINDMWTLSKSRLGARYVAGKIKEAYQIPMRKLAEDVYKRYVESNGDAKVLATLLDGLPKPAETAAKLQDNPQNREKLAAELPGQTQNRDGTGPNSVPDTTTPPQGTNLNTNLPPDPNAGIIRVPGNENGPMNTRNMPLTNQLGANQGASRPNSNVPGAEQLSWLPQSSPLDRWMETSDFTLRTRNLRGTTKNSAASYNRRSKMGNLPPKS